MKLLDTSAWIEYFRASKKGEKIKLLLEQERVYTSAISLAEISMWANKENLDLDPIIHNLKTISTIIPIEEELLLATGKVYCNLRKIKNKICLIDSLIYTTGIFHGLNIVTKDSDFEGLYNVEML